MAGESNWKRNFRRKAPADGGMTPAQKAQVEKNIQILEDYITKNDGKVPESTYEMLATYKKKITPSGKINSTKAFEDGIEFDSTLERNFYRKLKAAGYVLDKDFNYQQHFELQPAFQFANQKIRPISMFVDFCICHSILVDTKGLETPDWTLKWKMLKFQHRENYHYFTAKNLNECDTVIMEIKRILEREK